MLPEELLAEANGLLSSVQQGATDRGAACRCRPLTPPSAVESWRFSTRQRRRLRPLPLADARPRGEAQAPRAPLPARGDGGIEHVWRTLPLRQMTIGTTIALLVVGFTETLIFVVIGHLGHKPSFFGVLATLQGIGSIAGGLTAAWVAAPHRRGAHRGTRSRPFRRLRVAARRSHRCRSSSPAFFVAGLGIVWGHRRLQHGAPDAHAARDPRGACRRRSTSRSRLAQTASIATAPLLSTFVDYRVLLVVLGGGRGRKRDLPHDATGAVHSGRSLSVSSRLTTFGSAFPCVSRITWPTRKPSTPSLPPR